MTQDEMKELVRQPASDEIKAIYERARHSPHDKAQPAKTKPEE